MQVHQELLVELQMVQIWGNLIMIHTVFKGTAVQIWVSMVWGWISNSIGKEKPKHTVQTQIRLLL